MRLVSESDQYSFLLTQSQAKPSRDCRSLETVVLGCRDVLRFIRLMAFGSKREVRRHLSLCYPCPTLILKDYK